MFSREQIQYHTLWVRLVCCLSCAMAVMNASFFDILGRIDATLVYVITDGNIVSTTSVSRIVEWGIVLAVCLIPGIPRFERPVCMILCGAMLVFLDILATAGGYILFDILLPMASPVTGIFGSIMMLVIMAWSEEAMRRVKMESLINARVQFSDMLVHDLKKRISSVMMVFSLLEKKSPPDEKEKDLMLMMHASVDRMLLEVNNLLDIRKIEECGMRLARENFELKEVLEGIVGEHKPAAQIAGVNIRLEGDVGSEISADRHILSRIMTNLIWNAIQHAPHATDIVVAFRVSGGMAAISVTNKGEFIPLFRQQMMFQAFHANGLDVSNHRVGGTGLGLAFCKLGVEAHGGAISVESPLQGFPDGVRIVIKLPL